MPGTTEPVLPGHVGSRRQPSLPPLARAGLAALAGVTVVHLGALLGDPDGIVANVTQDLLMPLLAWSLVAATSSPRSRLVRLALVALGFSWLGDAAPDLAPEGAAFLVMVGFFLLAQACYIAAFLPRRRESVAARPIAVLPYAAAFVALIAFTREGAGSLLLPVIVYGLALTTMAVLATGLGRLAGLGGLVFMVSDALIAVQAFTEHELPAHGFWVMLTYVVGQTLIVVAVIRREAQGTSSSR